MMGWHCPFRIGTLTSRRRSPRIGSSYPIPEFGLLAESARTCVEKTRSDDMVDQTVVGAVNGVVDELTVERKQIPGEVLFEADRCGMPRFPRLRPEPRRGRTSRSLSWVSVWVERAVIAGKRIDCSELSEQE